MELIHVQIHMPISIKNPSFSCGSLPRITFKINSGFLHFANPYHVNIPILIYLNVSFSFALFIQILYALFCYSLSGNRISQGGIMCLAESLSMVKNLTNVTIR